MITKNKKAELGMSVGSIMGLLVTVILVIIALGFVNRFFDTSEIERDSLEYWKKQITDLDDGETTQLLPLRSSTAGVDKVFYFFPKSAKDKSFSLRISYAKFKDGGVEEISISEPCGDNSCMCVVDLKNGREYCEKVPEDFLLSSKLSSDEVEPFFYEIKGKTSFGGYPVFVSPPYVKKEGDQLIFSGINNEKKLVDAKDILTMWSSILASYPMDLEQLEDIPQLDFEFSLAFITQNLPAEEIRLVRGSIQGDGEYPEVSLSPSCDSACVCLVNFDADFYSCEELGYRLQEDINKDILYDKVFIYNGHSRSHMYLDESNYIALKTYNSIPYFKSLGKDYSLRICETKDECEKDSSNDPVEDTLSEEEISTILEENDYLKKLVSGINSQSNINDIVRRFSEFEDREFIIFMSSDASVSEVTSEIFPDNSGGNSNLVSCEESSCICIADYGDKNLVSCEPTEVEIIFKGSSDDTFNSGFFIVDPYQKEYVLGDMYPSTVYSFFPYFLIKDDTLVACYLEQGCLDDYNLYSQDDYSLDEVSTKLISWKDAFYDAETINTVVSTLPDLVDDEFLLFISKEHSREEFILEINPGTNGPLFKSTPECNGNNCICIGNIGDSSITCTFFPYEVSFFDEDATTSNDQGYFIYDPAGNDYKSFFVESYTVYGNIPFFHIDGVSLTACSSEEICTK